MKPAAANVTAAALIQRTLPSPTDLTHILHILSPRGAPSHVRVITHAGSEACVPAVEDFVVKVVLEGLAVLHLLLLLLQLVVRLGAGAAAPPRGGLVGVVPLLLVLAVQVGRLAGRQLHPCRVRGVRASQVGVGEGEKDAVGSGRPRRYKPCRQ